MTEYGENERLLPKKGDEGGEPSASVLRESRRLLMGCEIPPRFALVLMMGLLVGAALLRFEPPDLHTTSAPKSDQTPGSTVSVSVHDTDDPNVLDPLHGLKAVAPRESATLGGKLGGAATEIELDVDLPGPEMEFEGTGTPPNVIFILLDDVGMNDLGYLSTDLKTVSPFIDKLAEQGVKIEKYYTNHICTPARAALMTGRDTFRMGMQYEEIQSYQPWSIPMDEVTLAERFKAAGYATHMVGKWNLGNYAPKCYPFNRGFDTFLGYMGAQETYYTHEWAGYKDFGFGDKDGYIDPMTNTTRLSEELDGLYSTFITGDRAIQIGHEHAEKVANGSKEPLFMYLAFQAVHWPLNVPEDNLFSKEQFQKLSTIKSNYTRRLEFAKILYYLDVTLERVFGELDAMGMLDNTLVVFASDNGGCPANGGNNYPYRGVKHTQFEGGVRVPAFVHSKSTDIIPIEARGTTYGDMMHVTDWTPTLANLTGIPTAGMGNPLSGFDHWQAIIKQRPEALPPIRNELVLRRNSYRWDSTSLSMVPAKSPTGAYIHEGWKIVIRDKCTGWFSFNPNDEVRKPACEVATSPLGANSCLPAAYANASYMFNLIDDPYETHDLSMTLPDKFQEMVQRWHDASVDEVPSNFRQTDSRAFTVWAEVNDYVVAWLDDDTED